MAESFDSSHAAVALADFWKIRFKRERQLLGAVTSLLSKYGSTVDTDELHRAFLLTLMGHFAVGDAALYVPSPDGRTLEAAAAYGRTRASALPRLPLDQPVIAGFAERRTSGLVDARAEEAHAANPVLALAGTFHVVAPLQLENKLVGIVFLGPRLNRQPYLHLDLKLLDSLAAVSATTFNNALLYRNARLSAEELKKLLEVRTDIISRISHEFRTPLTVLRAGLDALPDVENGPRQWMAASVERLERLIESLLALSEREEIDTGGVHTDPLVAVHQSVGTMSTAAAGKNITLTVSSSESARTGRVQVSRETLMIILDVLLDNAITYSPEGSAVTVEVDVTDTRFDPNTDGVQLPEWTESARGMIARFTDISDALAVEPSGDAARVPPPGRDDPSRRYVVIRVRDEGIGIPQDEIALMAEPFRQATNCPDRGIKGKGLGLALAQRSAVANGGFLCCRSVLGAGTTFSLFLPAS
ncbi:MAG: HAMP domain-containing histidine kinase [Candidatus Krumholzibacteria bacterium]|nr:HAMP domain-containing histidine kinase [Candidatus Krumholzibacteria bacterium]MDH4337303.1 HAMP domain-containing histidine kinase [Candidatus Krumholzibacteria bacterium]MDH5269984.1 HAMP domain-containing histidine kinase [Candidatus Krumholzibacteria bacterium]MDH5627532.1 HAMP domain-containing histidine kinase [Candidatus Krumholzibacteria bacterium]